MKKNDIYRLKEEADISNVLSYLGTPVVQKGSAYFLRCPQPDHDDARATNCYFRQGWNNVYCQACGKATNAIDLIMYMQSCDYGTACDILWEIEGRPEWYYRKPEAHSMVQVFQLTHDEAEVIQFHQPSRVLMPVSYTSEKQTLSKSQVYAGDCIDGYLACNVQHMNVSDFMDQDMYERMVWSKAKASVDDCRRIKKKHQVKDNELSIALWDAADAKEQTCLGILQRLQELHLVKRRNAG